MFNISNETSVVCGSLKHYFLLLRLNININISVIKWPTLVKDCIRNVFLVLTGERVAKRKFKYHFPVTLYLNVLKN